MHLTKNNFSTIKINLISSDLSSGEIQIKSTHKKQSLTTLNSNFVIYTIKQRVTNRYGIITVLKNGLLYMNLLLIDRNLLINSVIAETVFLICKEDN